MSCDNHAVWVEQAMVAWRKTLLTTWPPVWRLTCGPFLRAMLPTTAGSGARAWWRTRGRQRAQNSTIEVSFCTTSKLVHDGDHDGVIRIFVGLFCELWGFLITLHYSAHFFPNRSVNYITWNNFLITRSVMIAVALQLWLFMWYAQLNCSVKLLS